MPTGYTYPIGESDDYSFNQFVWHCARSFGALMHMRDTDDTNITMPEEPSYYLNSIEKHQLELNRLKNLSPEEIKTFCHKDFNKEKCYYQELFDKESKVLQRYNSMFIKVNAWKAPSSEHNSLKEFMLSQLNDSIISQKDSVKYYQEKLQSFSVPDPQQWLEKRLSLEEDSLKYALKYAQEKLLRDQEQYDQCVNWINSLRESVPFPEDKC